MFFCNMFCPSVAVQRSSLSLNLKYISHVRKGITATNCHIDISIYRPTYGKKYIRNPWAVVSKYIVSCTGGLLHSWLGAVLVAMSALFVPALLAT